MKTLNFTPEVTKFDNPSSLTVKNAEVPITLDGKLDEADWNGAPSLLFGNGAFLKKQAGDQTVTGGADVKASFDSWGVTYHIPNTDSSWARVKFLRKGMDLFIGVQSNDKSICKFDWEGEGIFLQIKDNAGVTKEYKLYYQNIDSTANTIKYEEAILNSGAGAGFLPVGSTANDTTNVDNGYSAELRVRLDKLGYTTGVSSVQMSMNIFDPDGIQYNSKLPWPYGMMPFDSLRGSYYKSWWGSEWGDVMKTLNFTPEYDNPDSVVAVVATGTMTLDGKLTEADWANANTLVFGPANAVKTGTEKTVSGGADVKKSFDSWGVTYHVPYTDTSYTRVKFLVKAMNLYIGIQSPDKSICKFDWEGDGLFLQMKDNAGVTKEYKLYYQNIDSTANTIKYEEGVLNSGSGAGSLVAGSTVNDTTNVDNGYTAELMIKLGSLGYDATTKSIKVSMNIFDPDGFQYNSKLPWPYGMMPFDSVRGSYFKSWWGSEWGDVMKTIILPTRTGVEAAGVMPTVFALSQNYPNPFNPSTVINFEVPEQSNITLSVYDVIGREVATLAKGAYAPGRYNVVFNAQNRASGMYIYRMTGASVKNNATIFTATKKLMLLK